jgi:hypothetical protein
MSGTLYGTAVGVLIAASAAFPLEAVLNGSQTQTKPLATINAPPVPEYVVQGSVVMSTNTGNPWIMLQNYSYQPQVAPVFSVDNLPTDRVFHAVVYDRNLTCVGLLTNKTGEYQFVFVEADYQMCQGPLPRPREVPTQQPETAFKVQG